MQFPLYLETLSRLVLGSISGAKRYLLNMASYLAS